MIRFRLRKRAAGGGDDMHANGTELVLRVGPLGWRAWTHRLDDERSQTFSGDASDLDVRGVERLVKVLGLALQTIPQTVLKEPGPLTLVLDTPEVLFVDNRAQPLAAGGVSAATIRRHGQQLLNCRDVSYGRTELIGSGRQLYGFVDSAVLGDFLAALDRRFTRLEAVRGCHEALIQRGMSGDDEVYAGVAVSGEDTRLVLVNRRLGAVLVRSLPIGVLTLAGNVATLAGIPRKEALQGLAERDYLSGLRATLGDSAAPADEAANLGPIERALSPLLTELGVAIRASLDFFADQQACGRPRRLELLGDADRLNGLGDWLQAALRDVPGAGGGSLLVEASDCGVWPVGGAGINLLAGVEGSGLAIGKLRYTYVNRRLVIENRRNAAAGSRNRGIRDGEPSGGGMGGGGMSGGGAGRRRPRAGSDGRGGGWLARMLHSDAASFADEVDAGTARQYLLLAYALMAGLLFLAWDEYGHLAKRHQAEAVAYVNALNANNDLRRQLRGLGYSQSPVVVEVDKVLWTEKFLALANRINAHLWLTEVYLNEEERQLDKVKVLSKKLVIEGAALPSTRGHVAEIADYMARLEADSDGFMNDFREIAFEGSRIDDSDADRIVRFTLAAWYDENKRVEERNPEHKIDHTGGGGLDQTLENVEHRNRALERARRGDL